MGKGPALTGFSERLGSHYVRGGLVLPLGGSSELSHQAGQQEIHLPRFTNVVGLVGADVEVPIQQVDLALLALGKKRAKLRFSALLRQVGRVALPIRETKSSSSIIVTSSDSHFFATMEEGFRR